MSAHDPGSRALTDSSVPACEQQAVSVAGYCGRSASRRRLSWPACVQEAAEGVSEEHMKEQLAVCRARRSALLDLLGACKRMPGVVAAC